MIAVIFMVAFMVLLRLPIPEDLGDLSAVLFGAASLGMVFLSFLVAVLAIFGWQELRGRVERDVAEEVKKTKAELRSEMTGRTHAGLGLMFGRVCREKPHHIETQRPDLLDFAVSHTRKSLVSYDEMRDPPRERVLSAKNNLVFYLTMRGQSEDGPRCLELLQEVWDDAVDREDFNRQITCCFARLRFSKDAAVQAESRKLLDRITRSGLGTKRDQDEAESVLAEFPEQLRLEELPGN